MEAQPQETEYVPIITETEMLVDNSLNEEFARLVKEGLPFVIIFSLIFAILLRKLTLFLSRCIDEANTRRIERECGKPKDEHIVEALTEDDKKRIKR